MILFGNYEYFYNNKIKQLMSIMKEPFNKKYIDFIRENHQQIQPLKSCQLKKKHKLQSKMSAEFIESTTNNKIFFIADKNPKLHLPIKNPNPQLQEEEKLISMIHKKNQEIASSLLKEKKPLSDIIYQTGSKTRLNRVQKVLNNKNNHQTQRASDAGISYNKNNLPKINKIHQEEIKEKRYSSSSSENNVSVGKTRQRSSQHIQFQQINNSSIEKFLRLKQQSYHQSKHFLKDEEELILMKKKKKTQAHRKKIQKQKQRIKNSLEEFLEAKIIPHQDLRYKSLGTKLKSDDKKQMLEEANEDVKKQTVKILKQRKSKKIGINTKISNKYLFNDAEVTIYEHKIKLYRQFLFLVNLSHHVFDPLLIQDLSGNMKAQQKYKFYVGNGNNSRLIRALMKRRFWWTETDDPKEANFAWTQLKLNNFYQYQRISTRRYKVYDDGPEDKIQRKTAKKITEKKASIYKAPLSDPLERILTNNSLKSYKEFQKQFANEQKYQNLTSRLKLFPNLTHREEEPKQCRVHNHFQYNFLIGNKKALFYNLKDYHELLNKNVFNIIPLTFHIGENGTESEAFQQFLKYYKQFRKTKSIKNVWIIKPGQNSNRGKGIKVVDELYEISRIINSKQKNNEEKRTYIIQKYIERPLLYKGRKFDIRHFMLATKMYGRMRLYWFGEGYVRTSSYDYDIEEITDEMIHLTNDAIQKQSYSYGKFEEGNKISYTELQRYFDFTYPNRRYSITGELYPQMKDIALKAFKACYLNMDLDHTEHNFQVFGLDFMLDCNFNLYLIEVNTNPCLEMNCNLLNRVIPLMVENTLRLTIDPIFPTPYHYPNTQKHIVPDNPIERLQYELIFDEGRDGRQVEELFRNSQNNLVFDGLEDEEVFDNDGKEIELQIQ